MTSLGGPIYLFYECKSTNTDAEGATQAMLMPSCKRLPLLPPPCVERTGLNPRLLVVCLEDSGAVWPNSSQKKKLTELQKPDSC
jgi:hypothetical protein